MPDEDIENPEMGTSEVSVVFYKVDTIKISIYYWTVQIQNRRQL